MTTDLLQFLEILAFLFIPGGIKNLMEAGGQQGETSPAEETAAVQSWTSV